MTQFEGLNLSCQRGETLVFSGLDFALESGACLWLAGPNGSGKSSLLRLMAGLLTPLSGTLNWAGEPILKAAEAHRARLRYLGHLDAVKPQLTVAENLDFWAAFWGLPRAGIAESLERLGLGVLAHRAARYLSAGQKRRLALARLCLGQSELWLLDEPTNALDEAGAAVFQDLMMDHRKAGGIVVLSSHETVTAPGFARLDLGEAPGEARS